MERSRIAVQCGALLAVNAFCYAFDYAN